MPIDAFATITLLCRSADACSVDYSRRFYESTRNVLADFEWYFLKMVIVVGKRLLYSLDEDYGELIATSVVTGMAMTTFISAAGIQETENN